MLGHYDGLDGLKTGYIHASGFNLVTSAEREDHRLIGVVFGGKTPRSRDRHMANMLDDAFDEIANENPEEQGSADPPPMPPLPREKPKIASAEIAKPVLASSDGSIWGVQVGAYYSQKPAFEAAERALSKLPDLLEDGTVAVMPLKKSRGRVLYRARILGIQKKAAYRACYQFKKLSVPCLELRISVGAFELARNKD
jgi:D-alanyl-D-alanine carboxypeptidase